MPISARDTTLVEMLASHADLPLAADRITPVATLLAAWIKDANALSAKMRQPKYAHVVPMNSIPPAASHGDMANEQ